MKPNPMSYTYETTIAKYYFIIHDIKFMDVFSILNFLTTSCSMEKSVVCVIENLEKVSFSKVDDMGKDAWKIFT